MDRYSRQAAFPGVGAEGQSRMAASRVAVAGCGALGTVAAEMLVRAGVGRVRVIDRDIVEIHNLQRQSLFTEEDAAAGLPKAVAAARRLREINSSVTLEERVADLDKRTGPGLLEGCDLVLDGSDNFETRYLVNEICVRDARPWVYAACVGAYAVSAGIQPGETACLRCILEEAPPPGEAPTCETAGIIAPAVHVAASLAVATGMRMLLRGEGAGTLTSVDLWGGPSARVELGPPREDCPVCESGTYDYLEGRKGSREAVLCGRDAVQFRPESPMELDLEGLEERLRPLGAVERNPFLVRFRPAEGREIVCFRDGRCLITGTRDVAEARTLFARYVGA